VSLPGIILAESRKTRDQAKRAGLAGDNEVAKLLAMLLALSDQLASLAQSLAARERLVRPRGPDWVLTSITALLIGLAVGGLIGYRIGLLVR